MTKEFNNQTDFYPIVLLPERIKNSIDYKISEFEIANELNVRKPILKKLTKPERPFYSKREEYKTTKISGINLPFLLLIAIVSIGIGFTADSFIEGLGLTILIFALEAFGFFIGGIKLIEFEEKTNYKYVQREEDERKKIDDQFKKRLDNYYEELGTYRQKHEERVIAYNELIEKNRRIISFNLHFKNLKPNISASRGKVSIKRGIAELTFLQKINDNSELKDLVFIDMVPLFNWSTNGETYNPDFTLICKKTNLHIDIEIDEPYTLKDKKPIHYINSSDNDRNEFFLENNWCVIRFSEEQIIKESQECISTIKSIYNNIINKVGYYISDLKEDERWTYEKSFILQNNRHREKYLNG